MKAVNFQKIGRFLFLLLNLVFLSIVSMSALGQSDEAPQYSGYNLFDRYIDRFGNEVSLHELRISTQQLVDSNSVISVGKFRLFFENGSGLENIRINGVILFGL
jgi:hypothetical protein